MKIEDHIQKAERLSKTRKKLSSEEDWETYIENTYNTAVQLIAILCEKKFGEHLDIHKGISKFLMAHGLNELAVLFRELDELRQGRWYGKQGNGDAIKRADKILIKIEGELNNVEKGKK